MILIYMEGKFIDLSDLVLGFPDSTPKLIKLETGFKYG